MSAVDWILLVGWLVYAPIPFFWLVVHPLAEFWRRQRGRVYLATGGLVWFAIGVFFVITRHFWFGARFERDAFTYLLGAALGAVEVFIIPKAESALGRAILIGHAEIDPRQFPPRLVETGMYGRVRHPRYLGAMCVLFGLAVLAGSVRLLAFAAFSVPLYYAVTVVEERELAQRLGEPFREYKKRVPRFIPRLKNRL